MTAQTLDALAARRGGYVAASMLEQDIAEQFRGLGDPQTDELYRWHTETALALLARLTQRYMDSRTTRANL